MTKQILVFMASSIALAIIIGCPKTVPPQTEKPAQIQPLPQPPETQLPTPQPPETAKTKVPPAVSFHQICGEILTEFVDENGRVNYRLLKPKRNQLVTILDEFKKLGPAEYNAWPRQDKIALWLDAYNIQMLKIIVDNYPIESTRILRVLWPPNSIRHIPPTGDIGAKKWDKYKFLVMDEEFTLSDIEQKFLSGQFDEPRAFFALSLASISGPPLRNEPYYGDKLHIQLDDQVRKFLSNPAALMIDREKQIVYLSAIFEPGWYGNAFTKKFATDKKFKDHNPVLRAVLNFITNYIPQNDIDYLELGSYTVKYIPYDWRLNE